MDFTETYNLFVSRLRDDKELRYTYQSNIAMSFINELHRKGYKLPDQHEIANNAAKQFLILLMQKLEE